MCAMPQVEHQHHQSHSSELLDSLVLSMCTHEHNPERAVLEESCFRLGTICSNGSEKPTAELRQCQPTLIPRLKALTAAEDTITRESKGCLLRLGLCVTIRKLYSSKGYKF